MNVYIIIVWTLSPYGCLESDLLIINCWNLDVKNNKLAWDYLNPPPHKQIKKLGL